MERSAMNRFRSRVLTPLLWTATLAAAVTAQSPSPRVVTDPVPTVRVFLEALSNADLEGLVDTFHENATVFMPFANAPVRISGRAAIRERFRPVLEGIRQSGDAPPYVTLTVQDPEVQSWNGESAVVTLHLGPLPTEPSARPLSFGRRTFVLKRYDSGWRILHLHASTVVMEPTTPLLAPDPPVSQSPLVVIANVTVIDVSAADSRGARRRNQTVILRGDRILSVGPTASAAIPDGSRVIDGTGHFLIPGLWDMHVHVFSGGWNTASVLDRFLAHGVTGVRDMGSGTQRIVALRDEIAAGSVRGPRMVVSGQQVSGIRQGPTGERVFLSAEQVREQVRELKRAGVDFVKIYSWLSPPAFLAAVDEARKQGLTTAGHVPFEVRASEAARAGLRSIEHLEGVTIESTDLEDALRTEISDRMRRGQEGIRVVDIVVAQTERYRASYNRRKLQQLSAQFDRYGTWHCPTLSVVKGIGEYLVTGVHPHRRYVPESMLDAWERTLPFQFPADERARVAEFSEYMHVLATALHDESGRFLAGTDAPYGGQVPGVGLHDELASFVEVGLSPLEALRTATLNPAVFLGKLRDLGTVEPGKLADLALLDGDPLDDIANTRRINAVVVNGTYLGADTLRTMLAAPGSDGNGARR